MFFAGVVGMQVQKSHFMEIIDFFIGLVHITYKESLNECVVSNKFLFHILERNSSMQFVTSQVSLAPECVLMRAQCYLDKI